MPSTFPATGLPVIPLTTEPTDPSVARNSAANREEGRLSDESVLAQIKLGDREALSLLFRRYARLIHTIGRRIVRDDAEAEDLVQEVFLYVYRKSSSYDSSRSSPRSWLVQTSYYMALHRRMFLASRHHYGSLEINKSEARGLSGAVCPDYDRSMEGIFGREVWEEIIAALTPDQWETIRLHFFAGFTFGEISEKRGQPLGNIRHHYYRGLEKLRQLLAARCVSGIADK